MVVLLAGHRVAHLERDSAVNPSVGLVGSDVD
jgi:hypothetical protein